MVVPSKSVLDSESDSSNDVACFPPCRLPPRPTRVVLPTSRKPSLVEAGGSASKDAESATIEGAVEPTELVTAVEDAGYGGSK